MCSDKKVKRMTKITLIKGDGIGPEITDAVVKIIEARRSSASRESNRLS